MVINSSPHHIFQDNKNINMLLPIYFILFCIIVGRAKLLFHEMQHFDDKAHASFKTYTKESV